MSLTEGKAPPAPHRIRVNASAAAAWITGTTLVVDGGLLAAGG